MKGQELAEFGSYQGGEFAGDDQLLLALVSGCHVENAAVAARMSERTAYRRLADPEFRAKLDHARESLREAVLAKLADAAHDAIGTLYRLMESEDENVRLKAAKIVLDALTGLHTSLPKTTTIVKTTLEQRRES